MDAGGKWAPAGNRPHLLCNCCSPAPILKVEARRCRRRVPRVAKSWRDHRALRPPACSLLKDAASIMLQNSAGREMRRIPNARVLRDRQF